MRMIISGRHLEVTPAIKGYADKKVGKITKYFDNIIEVDVTLSVEHSKEGPMHVADALVFANGTTIKATATEKDLYAAIDVVIDILEKQITKHKEKLRDNKHKVKSNMTLKQSVDVCPSETDESVKKIINVKLAAKPMSVEEAILQMEALDKSFYTFMNYETEELNVVYKRADGDYGFVEPSWEH